MYTKRDSKAYLKRAEVAFLLAHGWRRVLRCEIMCQPFYPSKGDWLKPNDTSNSPWYNHDAAVNEQKLCKSKANGSESAGSNRATTSD